MTFNAFDFNDDRYICQLDLYSMLKMYEGDDQVFVSAYSYDICKLTAYLDKKKLDKGQQNSDITQKLKMIEKKAIMAANITSPQTRQLNIKSKSNSRESSEMEEEDLSEYDEEVETKKDNSKTKSRRTSMLSRKQSTVSRNPNIKRQMTNTSRSSGKSSVSKRSRNNSFYDHNKTDEEEIEVKENPFEKVFGKNIYQNIKVNKLYIEKMNFAEFKLLEWDYMFPQFIIDLIFYISAFQIDTYIKHKQDKQHEEDIHNRFQELLKKKKEENDKVDEV